MQDVDSLNAYHGYALQILHLLRSNRYQIERHDPRDLLNLLSRILELGCPQNIIIAKTFFDILIETLTR